MKKLIPLLICLFIITSALPVLSHALTLDYRARYDCMAKVPDHLLDVLAIDNDRFVTGGNWGLVLVQTSALPESGGNLYLDFTPNINMRNLYYDGTGYLYVNVNAGTSHETAGFAVVKLEDDTLNYIDTFGEEGVFYEKMAIAGDYLYVAAHSQGLHVYDISNREQPLFAGSLTEGFVDAWAVAIDGDRAYVADGAGGLKIVDISNRTAPSIIAGETLETAVGTAEDVIIHGDHLYVAAGAAGVLFYRNRNLLERNAIEVGTAPKDLALAEPYLAVATMNGVAVLELDGDGQPRLVAFEKTHRRAEADSNDTHLRICAAVDITPTYQVLCADWDFTDIYELVSTTDALHADINCSEERLYFPPAGGCKTVTISNGGSIPLQITAVENNSLAFSTNLIPCTLASGEELTVTINYNGATDADGSDLITIFSNDPDENPLPIQVYGRTDNLDQGETAYDFSLPFLTLDHTTGLYSSVTRNLSDFRGKIVWFNIYASW